MGVKALKEVARTHGVALDGVVCTEKSDLVNVLVDSGKLVVSG